VWAEEDGSIWVLDRGSEDSRLLVDTLVEIPGLAADAEHAYWAGTESPGGVVMSSVNRTRLLDGTTEELTSGSFVVVAVAAGPAGVYWISGGILTMDETTSSPRVISERGGNFLSMAGGDLYAADLGSGEIRMHALADGTEATLARGQLLVTHLAADEGAVAWTYQRPECTVKALQLP
jgi:hypothetical protein